MPEPSGSTGAQPSAEAIEAARERIVAVVDDHLAFNVSAYGTAWTGEREDASFIVANAADKALTAAYAIDAPAIHAAGRRAAMDDMLSGLSLCSAHRERQEDCSVCWPNLTALVAEHRRIAEAKGRAAGRDEARAALRSDAAERAATDRIAWALLVATGVDSPRRVWAEYADDFRGRADGVWRSALNAAEHAIEAAFPTTGEKS